MVWRPATELAANKNSAWGLGLSLLYLNIFLSCRSRCSRVENSDQLIHINSRIFPTTQTVDFFSIFFVDFLTHLSQILPRTILTLRRNQIRKNSYLAKLEKDKCVANFG
jgi:hypothetical protein